MPPTNLRRVSALKASVFLSASIPDRKPYMLDSDNVAIREAVLALIAVAARERIIVFGGHPAISPMIEASARSLDALDQIIIYQSKYFKAMIPREAKAFRNLRWTAKAASRETSLELMRLKMISSEPFCAAVLIGGMEGVVDECDMFRRTHPKAIVLPIASTGGAAGRIFNKRIGPLDTTVRDLLRNERRYRTLFRRLIPD